MTTLLRSPGIVTSIRSFTGSRAASNLSANTVLPHGIVKGGKQELKERSG